MTEQNLGFENPFIPELPSVGKTDIATVSIEKETDDGFVQHTLERLMAEQPQLTDKMKRWIAATARDPIEVGRMVETFTLTYRLLEVASSSEDDSTIDSDPLE